MSEVFDAAAKRIVTILETHDDISVNVAQTHANFRTGIEIGEYKYAIYRAAIRRNFFVEMKDIRPRAREAYRFRVCKK